MSIKCVNVDQCTDNEGIRKSHIMDKIPTLKQFNIYFRIIVVDLVFLICSGPFKRFSQTWKVSESQGN